MRRASCVDENSAKRYAQHASSHRHRVTPTVSWRRAEPELEAAILEAPESLDAYLVYGDRLLEHGEPLGELVTVQANLASPPSPGGCSRNLRARRGPLVAVPRSCRDRDRPRR